MQCNQVVFSGHAIQRMFERGIKPAEVIDVIIVREIIAEYPDDTSHPSFLLLGSAEAVQFMWLWPEMPCRVLVQ